MSLSDILYLDCETQSPVDVRTVGAPAYARAVKEQGSVMCWAHALNDAPIALWTPGASPVSWLNGHDGLFCAHNAEFEYWILREVYGIDICPERWIDTAAIARYNTLPGKLEEAGKFFGVEKDMDGNRIMMKLCRPRRPSKANPDPYWTPETKPDDFTRLYEYCRRDVEVSRMLHQTLPPLSDTEARVYRLTMKMNQRGMRVDIPALKKAKEIARADQDRISAAVKKITGYTAAQVGPLAKWCGMAEGIAKHKIRDALRSELTLPQRIVLEHRQEFAKASVKKINAFLHRHLDGYIHDGLIYGGAERTLRWSGSGVQPQNMARGAGKASLAAFDDLALGRLPVQLEDDDGNVFTSKQDILKSMIRGFILGPMLVGDFSQIEARTLAWYADDKKLLHAFATGQDPYKIMASKIYHRPVEEITKPERFMGKQTVLGAGYGLGRNGFRYMLDVTYDTQISEGEAEKIISAYRAASPTVVRFWGRIERTIRAAKEKGKGLYIKKPLGVKWTDEETFFIRLPSGRKIWYRQVEMTDREITCFGRLKTGGYGRIKIYGGAITGHIVQATARDFMAAALLRLDDAGFELFLTVHDEAVARDGNLPQFERVMRQFPEWAVGLPVDADCFRTERYRK